MCGGKVVTKAKAVAWLTRASSDADYRENFRGLHFTARLIILRPSRIYRWTAALLFYLGLIAPTAITGSTAAN